MWSGPVGTALNSLPSRWYFFGAKHLPLPFYALLGAPDALATCIRAEAAHAIKMSQQNDSVMLSQNGAMLSGKKETTIGSLSMFHVKIPWHGRLLPRMVPIPLRLR